MPMPNNDIDCTVWMQGLCHKHKELEQLLNTIRDTCDYCPQDGVECGCPMTSMMTKIDRVLDRGKK